jgi:hypothetical protein
MTTTRRSHGRSGSGRGCEDRGTPARRRSRAGHPHRGRGGLIEGPAAPSPRTPAPAPRLRARAVGGRLALALAALLFMLPAGCALLEPPPESPAPSPTTVVSGLQGRVLVGPMCSPPPATAGACLEPYRARLVVLDAEGEVALEVSTGDDGRFEALLPPGTYTIAPVPGGDPYPTAGLQAVSVVAGELTEVEIRYDSGLGEGR